MDALKFSHLSGKESSFFFSLFDLRLIPFKLSMIYILPLREEKGFYFAFLY